MRLRSRPLCAALLFGGAVASGCGARSGLRNPPPDAGPDATIEAGTEEDAGIDAPPPECETAADCPSDESQCVRAECREGRCIVDVLRDCDDGDPCTIDLCDPLSVTCSNERATRDADGDGFYAPLPGTLAGAPGSCGDDCDDGNPEIHPGATELCDGLDNDCNRNVDDGLGYEVPQTPPVRVSSQTFERAWRAGFAYDGSRYGFTLTGRQASWNGYFKAVDELGNEVVAEQPIVNVNAPSFAGGLSWNGTLYATAWEDARQDTNYEIYFNLLDPDGNKLMPDLRITNAAAFSLHPQTLWTRSEFVVLWDDRRFGDPRLFGQRIDAAGSLLGANVQLSPEALRAEYPAGAVGEARLGVAFTTLEGNEMHAKFRTVSFDLTELGEIVDLTAVDALNPNVAYASGRFVVTWERRDVGSVSGPSIYGAVLSENGRLLVPERAITTPARFARGHAILSLGDRIVLVWGEYRATDYDLYFALLSPDLEPLTAATRITTSSSDSLSPALALGPAGDIGILFEEWAPGPQVYFTRLVCGSAL